MRHRPALVGDERDERVRRRATRAAAGSAPSGRRRSPTVALKSVRSRSAQPPHAAAAGHVERQVLAAVVGLGVVAEQRERPARRPARRGDLLREARREPRRAAVGGHRPELRLLPDPRPLAPVGEDADPLPVRVPDGAEHLVPGSVTRRGRPPPAATTHALVNWSRSPTMSSRQFRSVMRRATGLSGSPTTNRCSPLGASSSTCRPSGDHSAAATSPSSSASCSASPPASRQHPRLHPPGAVREEERAARRPARSAAPGRPARPSAAAGARRATARPRSGSGTRRPRPSGACRRPAIAVRRHRRVAEQHLAEKVASLEAAGRRHRGESTPSDPARLHSALAPTP